jgi:protein O-GlcNAc transferase
MRLTAGGYHSAMPGEIFVNVRGDSRICVPATLDNLTTFVLLEQEAWFEDELGFVGACLEPGDRVADVGANLGVYTTALAQGVGPTGQVLAFEPTASTAALLRRTAAANAFAQARVVQAALSDQRGSALLEIGASPEMNALTAAPAAGRPTERVELRTLDDVVAEHGIDGLAFLKIDAEGHELPVARGAARTLRHDEPLVMFEIKHGDELQRGLLDWFAAQGLDAYRLVPGLGVLAPFRRDEPVDAFQLNAFACTPGRARRLAEQGLLLGAAPVAPAEPDRAEADAYLAGLPGWRGTLPAGAYGAALLRFAALQSAAVEPGAELAQLAEAQRLAARAYEEAQTVPRALTLARLCADLGQRRRAVDVLNAVLRREAGAPASFDEPCLSPTPRLAALEVGRLPEQWLRCAVVESWVRLCTFTTALLGPKLLPALEFLRPQAYYCADMERRRQLIRLLARLQERPEPHPLLAREAPDNLNPGYWTGASHW